MRQKQRGVVTWQLARETQLSNRQIRNIYAGYRIRKTVTRKKGSGRPKPLSKMQKASIRRESTKNPYHTCVTLKSELNLSASYSTILRHLKRINFTWKRTTSVPKLTEAHKVNRVNFATARKRYRWSQVVFSDESTFELDRGGYGYAQRGVPINKEKDTYSKKVKVWGAICSKGVAGLHVFEGTLDSQRYIEILKASLLPIAQEFYPDHWVYQQDNASCHVSSATRKFLEDEIPEVFTVAIKVSRPQPDRKFVDCAKNEGFTA